MDSARQVADWTPPPPRDDPRLPSEAEEEPALGIDVEGGGPFRMKRTEPFILPSRFLQRDVARDQFDQVEALADFVARVGAVTCRAGRRTGQWAAASLCFFASATTRSATWAGTSS